MMIEFKCEHCGKKLHLADTYAGRDGWCRQCKRMVIVPSGGRIVRVADLPKDEGFERLQRLLQYAATKADKFKIHLAKQELEGQHGSVLEEELRHANEELATREKTLLSSLETTRAEAAERIALLETALESAGLEHERRLGEELEASEQRLSSARAEAIELKTRADDLQATVLTQREGFDADSDISNTRTAALEADCAQLQEALYRERLASETANEETERLKEILASRERENEALAAGNSAAGKFQEALANMEEKLRQSDAEKQDILRSLEAHKDNERTLADTIARQQDELEAQTETLKAVQTRHVERDRTTREQILALEEQVALFDELKTRITTLQNKVASFDQERLDLSLELEEVVRSRDIEKTKGATLESRLHQAAEEKAVQLVALEDLHRDLSCKSDQIKRLKDELQELAEVRSVADLDHDRDNRSLHAAEERARVLAEDLSKVSEAAREHQRECTALQSALEMAESKQRDLESQLAQASSSTNQEIEATRNAGQRVAELERALAESRDLAATRETEQLQLRHALAEAGEAIQSLEAEISTYESEKLLSDEDEYSLSDLSGEADDFAPMSAVMPTEVLSEKQRHQERQKMMDVLSDFLDK